jgi:hypothetical protein
MSSETSKRLAVFERKAVRKILGAIKINNCWRRRHNNELIQLYDDLDMISFIRINRLRWIGHVNRMDNKRMAFLKFLLINLKEVGKEVDPNSDGGTVCMVI